MNYSEQTQKLIRQPVATQTGYLVEPGTCGQPGPFPVPQIEVHQWDGQKWEYTKPFDPSKLYGRCACGGKLYRKHRMASSLLSLIDQGLNIYMHSSDGPIRLTRRLSTSCLTCGQGWGVDLLVSVSSKGILRASLDMCQSML